MDIIEWFKMWEFLDYFGYWIVCELFYYGGGIVLLFEFFSWDFVKVGEMLFRSEIKLLSEFYFFLWILMLLIDVILNCLFYNFFEYEGDRKSVV